MSVVQMMAARARPYPIALAHLLAKTKPTEGDRMQMLNDRFLRMNPADRVRCRAELRECREAVGGRREASVSAPIYHMELHPAR